jgi:hypothetical protein
MDYHKPIYDQRSLICYWNLEKTRSVPLGGGYAYEASEKDLTKCDVVFVFDRYKKVAELTLKTKNCPPIFGPFAAFGNLKCDPTEVFKNLHYTDCETRSQASFFTTSHDREMMLNFLLTIAHFDKENVANQKLEQFVSNFL